MKVSQEEFKKLIEKRREEKAASRKEDQRLIESGEMTAEEVQEKNSCFPKDFFKNAKILLPKRLG